MDYLFFAYDIVNNPESADLIEDINISIVDGIGAIALSKERIDKQIIYKISIKDTQNVDYAISEVLMSLNLLMDYAVFVIDERLKLDAPRDPLTHTPSYTAKLIAAAPVKLSNNLQAFNWLVPYPSIMYGVIQESIYEKALLIMLSHIKRMGVDSQSYANNIELTNLKNSLLSYGGAMNSIDSKDRFKQLFNSLELALNYDGSEDKGTSFDTKVNQFSDTDTQQICSWRRLYNKLKHGAQNQKEIELIAKGISNFYKDLPFLRHTTNLVIQKRLLEVNKN